MTFCATRAAHLAAPVSMSLTRLFSCRCCILAAVVSTCLVISFKDGIKIENSWPLLQLSE